MASYWLGKESRYVVRWSHYHRLGARSDLTCCSGKILGSFSIDYGDGKSLLKWIRVFSNCITLIPIHWKCQMSANFRGVDFLGTTQVLKEKEKFVFACLRPPYNVKLGIFKPWSCSDGREIYKKACCTCKVVVLLMNPISFVAFSLPSPSSLLKLLLICTKRVISYVRYIKILTWPRAFLVIFSIFGLVFFVLKSLLGIARKWSREKFTIKPWSHDRILTYRTWAIKRRAEKNCEMG